MMMSVQPIAEDLNPWWRDREARVAGKYPQKRDLQPEILRRVSDFSDRRGLIVLGPRQVGKTVLLLQVADDLLAAGLPGGNLTYFDFMDYRLTEAVTPEAVGSLRPPGFDPDRPRVLLLDEIGAARSWDRWLEQLVDRGAGVKVLATDSAAALLRRGSRESGQGRWDEIKLQCLAFPEYVRLAAPGAASPPEALRNSPRLLPRYLACGGFPEHVWSDDPPAVRARLRSDIAERAVLRDLLREKVDVTNVLRLFVCLVGDSGAILDAKARADDLGVDPRTVREYVRLLTDAMLLVPLEKWSKRGTAGLRGRPRLYAVDHGLIPAFSGAVPSGGDPAVAGGVFECVVHRHLRCLTEHEPSRLTYYRKSDRVEADFILERESVVLPIEATASSAPSGRKLTGLRRVVESVGSDRGVVIFGGLAREKRGAIQLVPLAEFLLDPWTVFDE